MQPVVITNASGTMTSTMGLILKKIISGQLFGITSGVPFKQDNRVFKKMTDGSKRQIGIAKASTIRPGAVFLGIADLLTEVELFDSGFNSNSNQECVSPFEAVGLNVYLPHTGRRGRVTAGLTEVGITSIGTAGGALEVTSLEPGPFSILGDGGAPVVDGIDRLVGVVVGGNEDITFLAPINAILSRFGGVMSGHRLKRSLIL